MKFYSTLNDTLNYILTVIFFPFVIVITSIRLLFTEGLSTVLYYNLIAFIKLIVLITLPVFNGYRFFRYYLRRRNYTEEERAKYNKLLDRQRREGKYDFIQTSINSFSWDDDFF